MNELNLEDLGKLKKMVEGKMEQKNEEVEGAESIEKLELKNYIKSENPDLIFEDTIKMSEKIRRTLEISKENKQVLYGKVVSMQNYVDGILIILAYQHITVKIPAHDFFAYSDFKDLEKSSSEERNRRYRQRASRFLGASVGFIPIEIIKNEFGTLSCIGSRKEAMTKYQSQYFFSARGEKIEVGTYTPASILSVTNNFMWVECFGLEIKIRASEVSNVAFIEDLTEKYQSGDGILVAIKSLSIDEENRKVDIKVSHALIEEAVGMVDKVSDNLLYGRFKGTVIGVKNQFIIVMLEHMKIRGFISIRNKDYEGTVIPQKGDKIVMMVTKVDTSKNIVLGKCIPA